MFRKSPKPAKEGKKPRIWELGGNVKDLPTLDYTKDKPEDGVNGQPELRPNTEVSEFCIINP